MTEGTLILVGKNKSLQVSFTNFKGNLVGMQIPGAELSEALTKLKNQKIELLKDMQVEFEEVGGQPKKVREKGKTWDKQQSIPITSKTVSDKSNIKSTASSSNQSQSNVPGNFHNPYNFVPAPPRKTGYDELGDREAIGHGSYHHDLWSGRISVTLKTITPLLIPDAANATGDNHKIYPIRVGIDGKPYLPPTSIKGMLKTAYEMVTNSRFSILAKHDDRLAYRSEAKNTVFPARVERCKDGSLYLRIMEESGLVGNAAKLTRYEKNSRRTDKGEAIVATKYESTQNLPKHGDRVWVQLSKGRVTRIRPYNSASVPSGNWREGWVCVIGANINGKMNERVFIKSQDNQKIPITPEIINLWKELIINYQKIHEKDLQKRRNNSNSPQEYLGSEPGKTGWSRHIYDSEALEFKPGTLCYVERNKGKVTAVQPVTISRRLYSVAPNQLLSDTLKPSSSINELSPAERVFGWVNQNGSGAYKGKIRIHRVTCLSDDPIKPFAEKGLSLAILGEPKEQQARFYQAKDKDGNPLDSNEKEKGYSDTNQGLRGRKVYPHHNGLPEGYWRNPTQGNTQQQIQDRYQEYRRSQDERDDQNRSMKGWVKEGVEFKFTLDVTNLSSVELGALLWLLSLPDNHYHRLGGGKPLGFGSIHLSVKWTETDLRTGQDWRKYYSSLLPIDTPNSKLAEQCIQEFKNAVCQAYGNGSNFDSVSFIAAFCRAAQGFDDNLPIHYPRITKEPNPKGEGFKWFVDNERTGGKKLPLPLLINDRGLPINPKNSR